MKNAMNANFHDRLKSLTASESTDKREVGYAMKILAFLGNSARFRASLDRLARVSGQDYTIPPHLQNIGKRARRMRKLFKRRAAGHYRWYDNIKFLGL